MGLIYSEIFIQGINYNFLKGNTLIYLERFMQDE